MKKQRHLKVTSSIMCVCLCSVAQLCLTLCDCMDCSLPGSSVHGILQARILEWVGIPFLLYGMFPTKGLNPGLPLANSLPSEPPGKPKNTGVGSLSLLQRIFPTQELTQGFLHSRWVFYQLSYQGNLLPTPPPQQILLKIKWQKLKMHKRRGGIPLSQNKQIYLGL